MSLGECVPRSSDTLNSFYQEQSSAREAVDSAAGYAAFSNFGMKIPRPAAARRQDGKTARRQDGKSEDFAVKNKAEATTCIKMAEYHASLGTSAKKFQQTRVFENEVHYFRLAVRRTGNRCGEDR